MPNPPAPQTEAAKLFQSIGIRRRSGCGRKLPWTCRLLEMRHRLHLTLRDIEGRTGVSSAVLSTIEHGTDPQLTTASAIAKFFGVSIETMWPEKLESIPSGKEIGKNGRNKSKVTP